MLAAFFFLLGFHKTFETSPLRITASMNKPDDPASRKLHGDGDAIKLGMKSRAYLGNSCADGDFKQSEYMKAEFCAVCGFEG